MFYQSILQLPRVAFYADMPIHDVLYEEVSVNSVQVEREGRTSKSGNFGSVITNRPEF